MKKRLLGLVMILALIVGVMGVEICFASSEAVVSLKGSGTYEKGDSFNVTLAYSGHTYGSATAKVTYDSSVLEYKSCSGGEAYGSGGTVTVTMSNGSGTTSLSCKLKFTAKKAGSSYVTAATSDVYNLDLEELSADTKSVKVTVKDTSEAASNNANLSSLLISNGTLSPAFSSSVTSYTINVPNNVTVCAVSAAVADSKSTYQVTGSKNLSVGENVRKVIVTAESGKTKTYTLTINRKAADGSTVTAKPDSQTEPQTEQRRQVTVSKTAYYLCDDLTGVEIPEGFTAGAAKYEDQDFSIIENSQKDVKLALLENKTTGEQAWFFFDSGDEQFTKTQRFSTAQIIDYEKERMISQSGGGEDGNDASGTDITGNDGSKRDFLQAFKTMDTMDLLLVMMGITLGLLLIIIIILQIRNSKRR